MLSHFIGVLLLTPPFISSPQFRSVLLTVKNKESRLQRRTVTAVAVAAAAAAAASVYNPLRKVLSRFKITLRELNSVVQCSM